MTFYPKLFLRYPFETAEVGGEHVAVAVEEGAEAFHGVIRLENEPAVFMFEKLREGITLPDLIYACMQRYDDSSVEEVGPKVLAFLDSLKEQGLIQADMTQGVKDERR